MNFLVQRPPLHSLEELGTAGGILVQEREAVSVYSTAHSAGGRLVPWVKTRGVLGVLGNQEAVLHPCNPVQQTAMEFVPCARHSKSP